MAKLDAIFFDLGDTLIDLGEGRGSYEARLTRRANRIYDLLDAAGVRLPARETFCEALAEGSEARYQAALAEQQGLDLYAVLRWFFDHMGITVNDQLLEASAEAYCRESTTTLRRGALVVLAQLQVRGLRLGVISNTIQPARYLDQVLVRRKLYDFFPVRVYSSEVGVAKPHPEIFRVALAALDVAPERAVYVGDRLEADVAGAHGVGMKAVLIEVPHRVERNPDIVPDARIRELPELLDVLPALGG